MSRKHTAMRRTSFIAPTYRERPSQQPTRSQRLGRKYVSAPDEQGLHSSDLVENSEHDDGASVITFGGSTKFRDSDDEDFASTTSVISKTTFYTAISSVVGQHRTTAQKLRLHEDSDYARLLKSKSLWPVNPSIEQDWSGRGQHVEFQRHERDLVNSILEAKGILGSTSLAVVERVKCRRILLARKTVFCRRQFTKKEAIEEVSHLTRLCHSHILRVVGTYTIGKELAILMYPVAEYNLKEFFAEIERRPGSLGRLMASAIPGFLGCLSSAVRHVHGKLVKHMDIKPGNILVREQRATPLHPTENQCGDGYTRYKVYIADFGISRCYGQIDEADTDGPTSFTRQYAAPEVIQQESRGLSADIFSLGCVFLEMAGCWLMNYVDRGFLRFVDLGTGLDNDLNTVSCLSIDTQRLRENLESIIKPLFQKGDWLYPRLATLLEQMLHRDPQSRPSAQVVSVLLAQRVCCGLGPVSFEVMN